MPTPVPTPDITIACDCCSMQHTDACGDCVVSFLLERDPEDAVVIDADEARAMRTLERAGLLPTLRFAHRAGSPPTAGPPPRCRARTGPGERRHLLVTNDFPPKVGGIQVVPVGALAAHGPRATWSSGLHTGNVASTGHRRSGSGSDRVPERPVLAEPGVRRGSAAGEEVGAGDAWCSTPPYRSVCRPRLGVPYAVILHGAEVTVPARLPGLSSPGPRPRPALVVSAGGYPAPRARRPARPSPVVRGAARGRHRRFVPLDPRRAAARLRLGTPSTARRSSA